MKQKYACRYGATSTRKCLVPFSGNGYFTCRLYELGQCHYDERGNDMATGPAPVMHDLDPAAPDRNAARVGWSSQRPKPPQSVRIESWAAGPRASSSRAGPTISRSASGTMRSGPCACTRIGLCSSSRRSVLPSTSQDRSRVTRTTLKISGTHGLF
jgi:hypothetical protein